MPTRTLAGHSRTGLPRPRRSRPLVETATLARALTGLACTGPRQPFPHGPSPAAPLLVETVVDAIGRLHHRKMRRGKKQRQMKRLA